MRDSESGALLFVGIDEREDRVRRLEERVEKLEKEISELKERIYDVLYLCLEGEGMKGDGKV